MFSENGVFYSIVTGIPWEQPCKLQDLHGRASLAAATPVALRQPFNLGFALGGCLRTNLRVNIGYIHFNRAPDHGRVSPIWVQVWGPFFCFFIVNPPNVVCIVYQHDLLSLRWPLFGMQELLRTVAQDVSVFEKWHRRSSRPWRKFYEIFRKKMHKKSM